MIIGTLITKGNNQFGLHQTGKDKLEFYITTINKETVQISLPDNWENNWHFVTAHYDGKEIYITIDGAESEQKVVTGRIKNTPFPVNIGRNVEIHGQETDVYICDAIIDQIVIFDKYVNAASLKSPSDDLKKEAALWLDFEEVTTNGEFFSYGIGARTYGTIWPDRRPQPEMWQIKKSGQPVSAKLLSDEKGIVEITNRYLFTNLDELKTIWMLKADNDIIETGELVPDIAPQESGKLNIPFHKPEIKEGVEYRLLLSFRLKEETVWADTGFEIAWEELELPWYKPFTDSGKPPARSLTINEKDGSLTITGEDFRYVFDNRKGLLVSLQVSGREMINRGAQLNVWRAPLANETDEWTFWSANIKHRSNIFGRFAGTEWYGRGPQENYPDRKSGYKTGVYKSTVNDMSEPYLIPQDHGLRTDNRWVRLTDSEGIGLEFSGNKLFNFNVYPFSTDNLTKALYTYQLQPAEAGTFNFDYATSGVGCTAVSVFPEYQVIPQRYDYTMYISLVK